MTKVDGKQAKLLILDDLHDTKVADFSKLDGIGKQWYEHCVGRSNLTVLGGTVMSKGNLNKFTKKQVPRGQLKNGTATLLEWKKIKENENAENKG